MRTVTCPIPRSRRRASARRVRHPRRGVCDSFTEDSSPIDYPSLRFPPSRATRDARCDLARDADHPHPSLHASAGVPWTEEEHRLFLLGLQKLGKVRYNSFAARFDFPRTTRYDAASSTRAPRARRRRRRQKRARVRIRGVARTRSPRRFRGFPRERPGTTRQPGQPRVDATVRRAPRSLTVFRSNICHPPVRR